MQGRVIRKLFPASNTTEGFYSFFDYIIQSEGRKLYILKGGPGVGKSTFMREIENYVLEKGFDVEEFYCSSDPESLDAIAVPQLKVALLDGTAPHIIDPKNPGVTDELVHLGDSLDREKLAAAGETIIKLSKKKSKLFSIAYSQLREARVAYDEWSGYVNDALNYPAYIQAVSRLLENIFTDAKDENREYSKSRHLFASAITPKGLWSYIDSLIKPSMKIYALEGMPGSGAKEALSAIANQAELLGLATEQMHCPFEPKKLNMVIIPSIGVTVIYTSGFGDKLKDIIDQLQIVEHIDFDSLLEWDSIEEYKAELEDAKNRWKQLVDKAVEHIARAKEIHGELERYYVAAMDFDDVKLKVQEVKDEIDKRINQNR